MREESRVVLFIASSLDGYIARPDGRVDWLFQDGDYGYDGFYESIGSVIMGGKTFEMINSFGEFPYKEKECFVFSRKTTVSHPDVEFVSDDIADFTRKLKTSQEKDIWLCGGSEIISVLMAHHLVDQIILSVHPVIIGEGIALFKNETGDWPLRLVKCQSFSSGLVQLGYDVV
ncbi:MAG: dihydrofolate reductase family protein [Spirochaetota bacterium]|nr:dihydrofolate reductase family protein [Spirochaetota bacterium]